MNQRKQYIHMIAMNQLHHPLEFKLMRFLDYIQISRAKKKVYENESIQEFSYLKFK